MPFFAPTDDPGANFPELLRRIGMGGPLDANGEIEVPHATTCVALTFADGVVMAGDRRATSGNLISHRAMEKVVQADSFSGVAIAGAAGPAGERAVGVGEVELPAPAAQRLEVVEVRLQARDGADRERLLVHGRGALCDDLSILAIKVAKKDEILHAGQKLEHGRLLRADAEQFLDLPGLPGDVEPGDLG